jgi:hypothetical protein
MLDRLDAVDWPSLTHAYGPADDLPRLLLAGDMSEVSARLAVPCSAAPAVVPFLVEIATPAALWLLATLADRSESVEAEEERLIALLGQADAAVRAAAAYAIGRAGLGRAALTARWEIETDATVRACLVPGLRLTAAITDPDPAVRASAALTAARLTTPPASPAAPPIFPAAPPASPRAREALAAGEERPAARRTRAEREAAALLKSPEFVEAVASAVEAGAEVPWLPAPGGVAGWLEEVFAAVPGAGLARRLLGSEAVEVRRAGLRGVSARAGVSRGAPRELVPLVGAALRDPGTEGDAVEVLRRAGRAAGRFADELAAVAGRYPEVAAKPSVTAEVLAVQTLMRLRDPRWVRPVALAAEQGDPGVRELRAVPFDPGVLTEVCRNLRRSVAAGRVLTTVLGAWGERAAVAVPEIVPLLDHEPEVAAEALLRLGHRDAAMVAGLRKLAAAPGGLEAAHALFRLTGELEPALRALLRARPPVPSSVIDGLGPLLAPLVPRLELTLTDAAAEKVPQRHAQLLAARVVTEATGDPIAALPTVQAILLSDGAPVADAATFVTELAGRHRPTLLSCVPELREAASGPFAVAAVRALWRLGVDPGEWIPVLVDGVAAGHRVTETVTLLRELAAAFPDAGHDWSQLRTLLRGDRRLPWSGAGDDLVWLDETLS